MDELWDVKARESKNLLARRLRKKGLESQIALGKRALQLRSQPGFQDFQKEVQKLHKHVIAQMVACEATDSYMRILQGKAQALEDMERILVHSEKAVETLEAQLAAMQNEEEALPPREREPGKVKT